MKNLKDFEFGKVEVDSVFGGKVQETSSQNTVTIVSGGISKDDGDDSDWD